MKVRSVKSMIFIFLFIILSVNILCNYACLSYLQNINEELVHKECNTVANNIRNEFEQKIKLIHNVSSRVNRELFWIDYFRYENEIERCQNQDAVREYVDLLNEFMEEQVHVMIADCKTGTYDNYSRILSKEKLSILIEHYERMNTQDEVTSIQVVNRILDMGETFWILELQPVYIADYSNTENKRYGSIMTAVILDKQELTDRFDIPQSLDISVYGAGLKHTGLQEEGGKQVAASATKGLETSNTSYIVECVLHDSKEVSGFHDIRSLILVQLLVGIILAGLCICALIRYIAHPLHIIVEYMMSVDFGTKSRMQDNFACLEISIVASQFNALIDRLYDKSRDAFHTQQRLYEMKLCEKERDMKALQSQINPHFIYNMLENIRVLAEMEKNKEVAEVTIQMAQFLRYSLYVNGFVTLEDELKASEVYLEVMKICYDNMFGVEYFIEDELRTMRVPKMIIQPLIGNVFKHGFVFEHNNNLIKVEVKSNETCVLIRVYDNGIGIDAAVLERLNQELNSSTLLEGDKGFGLYSINRRIKTIYGEEYGVSVVSMQGCEDTYTCVTVSLPIWMEEDESFVYSDFSR